VEAELKILRTLCDEAVSREERLQLLNSYAGHSFAEPEHQVVFESVRALFPRGPITSASLIVHLTNRGFPDIDVEKYCPAAPKL
jgi:hypothetical protein